VAWNDTLEIESLTDLVDPHNGPLGLTIENELGQDGRTKERAFFGDGIETSLIHIVGVPCPRIQ